MARLPSFFIPHGGGPCFFMEWTPPDTWKKMADYLRHFTDDCAKDIRAVIVISAHWEADTITVTGNNKPDLIYDYHGFPPHTYELAWPAPGHPELASRVSRLLTDGGIACDIDNARGFDHGVFIPLLLTFPSANIPTIQISLSSNLSPELHFKIGELISPLRDENILIIGSGMSYHDVGALMGRRDTIGSDAFDDWLIKAVQSTPDTRKKRLLDWETAPNAKQCHPREEHLIPLHVVAGTAAGEAGKLDYTDNILGAKVSAFRFG